MDLTVLVPGIRPKNWLHLFSSICRSFYGEWELIIISPYDMPKELEGMERIVHVKDWGSPIRCRQIGLERARGQWLCYAADDVLFCEDSLDLAFEKLKLSHMNYKTVIVGKYVEGETDKEWMTTDTYYMLKTHAGLKDICKWLPDNYVLINTGVVSTRLLKEIGGWDCSFEVCALACVDLSIRLQNYHVFTKIQDEPIFKSTHSPDTSGDHEPIHNAQVDHDQPLLMELYSNKDATKRIHIPLDNWKNTPERWERRFGNEITT